MNTGDAFGRMGTTTRLAMDTARASITTGIGSTVVGGGIGKTGTETAAIGVVTAAGN